MSNFERIFPNYPAYKQILLAHAKKGPIYKKNYRYDIAVYMREMVKDGLFVETEDGGFALPEKAEKDT